RPEGHQAKSVSEVFRSAHNKLRLKGISKNAKLRKQINPHGKNAEKGVEPLSEPISPMINAPLRLKRPARRKPNLCPPEKPQYLMILLRKLKRKLTEFAPKPDFTRVLPAKR
ncbi:MAG TPA: hypothetical protein DCO86_05260, partial [Spirochaetaceae bacterium]|nr:hypothetical protein [Spirochaetaceae bacterium]